MRALAFYENCRLCGRTCKVNRPGGETGFCGSPPRLKIAWAGIHYGEEPVICGEGGSGAVFLSGCTLKCFFCQNRQISSGEIGREIDVPDFEDICLMLQRRGAENINIVTGTQFIPSLAEGIHNARRRRLAIPVVWNSSGYEDAESLPLLDKFVDIYLPDLKTLDGNLAHAMFGAADYPNAASAAIKEMAASRPLRWKNGEKSVLASGVIVRHLVLPGLMENTQAVLEWFADNMTGKALLSLMFQYAPPAAGLGAGGARGEWARRVSTAEYEKALALLDELNIDDGFVQEPPTTTQDCLPDFSKRDAFPEDLARPYWFCGDFQ